MYNIQGAAKLSELPSVSKVTTPPTEWTNWSHHVFNFAYLTVVLKETILKKTLICENMKLKFHEICVGSK